VRILALDTATENCSAALLINGRLNARERLLERGHAEHILPMIDELLAESGVSLASLDAVAFGRGPGAFTGVRLAASVTQGLAFGAGVPVVAVSDLAALAQRALEEDATIARVLVCMDARMHEVYWACFERAPGDLAQPFGEERVSPPADVQLPGEWQLDPAPRALSSRAAAWTDSATASAAPRLGAAGSGFAAYPELRLAVAAQTVSVRERLLPAAREIALLAAPEVAAGRFLRPEQALPVYLREDVTQQKSRESRG
jgi:tRNA threonylcarbamoyladenosine biosynthesis protein TsaB